MIDKEILGGVSPLKQKRQSKRGGGSAKKATSSTKRAGGFAASKGKRGGGGRNVGGYNAQTRFKASKWTPPPSGGTRTMTSPPAGKPYSYDPEGRMQVNPPASSAEATASSTSTSGVPGTIGTPAEGKWVQDAKNLPRYRQAWDNDLEKIRSKYTTYEDYVGDIEGQKDMAAKGDWEGIAKKKGISVKKAKETFARRKDKNGQWRWVETKAAVAGTKGTSGSSSSEASASSTSN